MFGVYRERERVESVKFWGKVKEVGFYRSGYLYWFWMGFSLGNKRGIRELEKGRGYGLGRLGEMEK